MLRGAERCNRRLGRPRRAGGADVQRRLGVHPTQGWVAGLGRGGQRTVMGADGTSARRGDSLDLERPTVFIYDNLPGGVGLAEKAFALCDDLLEQARSLIVSCYCEAGCPSCVGPIGDVEDGARNVAVDLADWLTGRIASPRGPGWDAVSDPARCELERPSAQELQT